MHKSLRILWLDPDNRTIDAARPLLVEQGWIVDQASKLVDALDLITRESYSAVIFDLQLPDALGTDAWGHIRKMAPGIIGIMTTGSMSLFHLIRVDSLGLTAYLHKPLSIQEVTQMIENVLGNN